MSRKFGRFFDPRDSKRPERISLAYGECTEVPHRFVEKYGDSATELDLSYNKFFDMKSLSGFIKLNTIILDHNLLSARTTFPALDTVEILWVNHNQITNLSIFIETISKSYPNLRYLSMINNKASPSYFNGGTYSLYKDYRHFVISSFEKLEVLDGIAVTAQERREAMKVYGKRRQMRKKGQIHSNRTL
ncbi:leucine-rich melanocyte differentiation-associated protein-like [Xenia sp. Carnegie-2017]|uniref:leucine-rich melanocyte differentiation-associated protein-like n=1 Tax=Xenia sp. Carnegie-2017 TaxID=2897299 RepID=UPI001F0465B1|nr:leucine-rich melanocyte differentiation-associated protein-like [Xenia sp. Carnegie-2017]